MQEYFPISMKPFVTVFFCFLAQEQKHSMSSKGGKFKKILLKQNIHSVTSL